jgi:octanoyl-[GcvH]:protein N-octanoyltransferase
VPLGVEAQLGAVPGEYCPGAHSVNARGETKLVGTAQRVLRQAWLFASLVVVGDETELRTVLTEIYGHLGQPFDPKSVGSLSLENAALDTRAVARVLLTAYAGSTVPLPISAVGHLLEEAARLAGDHRV